MKPEVVVGLPGCGKSWYAEKMMTASGGRVLYVATLPRIEAFADTIRRHENRRPKEWRVVELIGDLSRDTRQIRAATRDRDRMLLDGLQACLIRQLILFPGTEERVEKYALALIREVMRFRGSAMIVEAPVQYGLSGESSQVLQRIYDYVIETAERVTVVEDAHACPVTKSEARWIAGTSGQGNWEP